MARQTLGLTRVPTDVTVGQKLLASNPDIRAAVARI